MAATLTQTKAADDAAARLKIFISYSRRDSAVADQVVTALTNAGFDVTIDTRDLPFGEEWQEELRGFIQDCDTVVWLVSPDSVGSHWVNWELGEVQRAGKRLIPIVARPTEPEALPTALGKIHLLPPNGAFVEAEHLAPLVEALETDRAWVKDHTRLGVLARQWAAGGKGTDRLLRGKALADAETWRTRQPAKAPPPDPLILDLLAASEQGAKRRQRQWIGGLAASVVLFAGIAVYAVIQQGIAVENEQEAVKQTKVAEEQRAVAEEQTRLAVANEKIANERAARLSVPAARALREDGFNQQALLTLLQSAGTFDDATAPTAMRIEFEKILERANHEVLHAYVPADVTPRIADRRLVLDAPEGAVPQAVSDVLADASAMDPGKPYDCTAILANPAYASARITLEERQWMGLTPETCTQKGRYVLMERKIDAPHQLETHFIIFDLTADLVERLAVAPLDYDRFDWWGADDGFQFAYAEDRLVHIKTSEYAVTYQSARFAQSAEAEKLLFVAPNRLITISRPGPDPADDQKLSRMVILYDAAPRPLFVEPLKDGDALTSWDLRTGKGSPFRNAKVCESLKDIDGNDAQACQTVSADGLWIIKEQSQIDPGDAYIERTKIELVKASAPDAPVFSTVQDARLFDHLGTVIFHGTGPDLLLVDGTTRDRVMRVSPPAEAGGAWTKREIYRDPEFIYGIRADATGDRLTVYERPGYENYLGAKIVSISANEVWRAVGGDTNDSFIAELKDRDATLVDMSHPGLPDARGTLHRYPALSELVELGAKAVPGICQPTTPRDWSTSPCVR